MWETYFDMFWLGVFFFLCGSDSGGTKPLIFLYVMQEGLWASHASVPLSLRYEAYQKPKRQKQQIPITSSESSNPNFLSGQSCSYTRGSCFLIR